MSYIEPLVDGLRPFKHPNGICVCDTGVFIQLKNPKYEVVIPPSVLAEIRDKRARDHLQFLAGIEDIKTERGEPEDYDLVKKFAKATGDLTALSATDLDVAALAVKIQRQYKGSDTLTKTPPLCRTLDVHNKANKVRVREVRKAKKDFGTQDWITPSNVQDNDPFEFAFTMPKSDVVHEEDRKSLSTESDEEGELYLSDDKDAEELSSDAEELSSGADIPLEEEALEQLEQPIKEPRVVAMSTDFALQNVILTMGIEIESVDTGRQIRELKRFVKKCNACRAIIMDVEKIFCSSCGNNALRKVEIKYGNDGSMTVHDRRWFINKRGLNTTLPKPAQGKAGKFKPEIILCEDQLLTKTNQWRKRKEQNERKKVIEMDLPFASLPSGKGGIPKLVVGFGGKNHNVPIYNKHKKK